MKARVRARPAAAPKVGFVSLGCPKALVDSEHILTRLRAEGQAAAVRVNGEAEADAVRAVGAAKADAYKLGIAAVGGSGYTAIQLATILGENHVKLVPEIAVSGDGSGGLVNAMIARMLAGAQGPAA